MPLWAAGRFGEIDAAVVSAVSALAGSAIGAVSSPAGSWLTMRGQLQAQALRREADKREALCTELIQVKRVRRPVLYRSR